MKKPMSKGRCAWPCSNLLQLFCLNVALVTNMLECSQAMSLLHKWGFGKVVVPGVLFPCEEETQVSFGSCWHWVACAKRGHKEDQQEMQEQRGRVMAPVLQTHRNQALPGNFGHWNCLFGPQRSLMALQLGLPMAQRVWIISIFELERQICSFLAEQGRETQCYMFCTNPHQKHFPCLQRLYLSNSCIKVPESETVFVNFCFYF